VLAWQTEHFIQTASLKVVWLNKV